MAVLADGQVGVATQLLAIQHQASGPAQVPASDVDPGIGHALHKVCVPCLHATLQVLAILRIAACSVL